MFDPAGACRKRGAFDYLPLARLLWPPAGQDGRRGHRLQGPAVSSGWSSRCCSPRSISIRRKARRGSRRGHPRDARGRRPRLPAADRARGLGATLIEPALAHLQAARRRGAHRASAPRACALAPDGSRRSISAARPIALAADDAVILAVPPYIAASLVRGLEVPTEFRAIVNAHFRIEPPAGQPPILGVLNGTVRMDFRLSGPALRHHQRRRSADRHAARRTGQRRSGAKSRA